MKLGAATRARTTRSKGTAKKQSSRSTAAQQSAPGATALELSKSEPFAANEMLEMVDLEEERMVARGFVAVSELSRVENEFDLQHFERVMRGVQAEPRPTREQLGHALALLKAVDEALIHGDANDWRRIANAVGELRDEPGVMDRRREAVAIVEWFLTKPKDDPANASADQVWKHQHANRATFLPMYLTRLDPKFGDVAPDVVERLVFAPYARRSGKSSRGGATNVRARSRAAALSLECSALDCVRRDGESKESAVRRISKLFDRAFANSG